MLWTSDPRIAAHALEARRQRALVFRQGIKALADGLRRFRPAGPGRRHTARGRDTAACMG